MPDVNALPVLVNPPYCPSCGAPWLVVKREPAVSDPSWTAVVAYCSEAECRKHRVPLVLDMVEAHQPAPPARSSRN